MGLILGIERTQCHIKVKEVIILSSFRTISCFAMIKFTLRMAIHTLLQNYKIFSLNFNLPILL